MNILERIRPSAAEQQEMDEKCAALVAAATDALQEFGITGTPTVQGSIAKGTWLAGGADVDLFLLLDTSLEEDELRAGAEKVGHAILSNPQKKYAQHPYVIGTFEGLEVDLVPAYAVDAASAHMSAVDRTPFHTQWVTANANDSGRDEIRLAKRWCKGVEIYGADTATGGFSGYLVEVLCIALGGFDGFIQWLATGASPRRISVRGDEVDDPVSPLIVVDPVDAARNCAAAITTQTLERATEAARAYQESPTDLFFFPNPPHDDPGARAEALEGHDWLGVTMVPETDRLDIVFPQFQKAGRLVAQELGRAGFPVLRHSVEERDGVAWQFFLQSVELPRSFVRIGPPANRLPNAEKFMAKWRDHPDRAGDFIEVDGKVAVEVHNRVRTPLDWLRIELPRYQGGKHVMAALKNHEVHTEPSTSWAPNVTDFVLGRRPWER